MYHFTPKHGITLPNNFSTNCDLIFTQSDPYLKLDIQGRFRIQAIGYIAASGHDLVPCWIPQTLNGKCKYGAMECDCTCTFKHQYLSVFFEGNSAKNPPTC